MIETATTTTPEQRDEAKARLEAIATEITADPELSTGEHGAEARIAADFLGAVEGIDWNSVKDPNGIPYGLEGLRYQILDFLEDYKADQPDTHSGALSALPREVRAGARHLLGQPDTAQATINTLRLYASDVPEQRTQYEALLSAGRELAFARSARSIVGMDESLYETQPRPDFAKVPFVDAGEQLLPDEERAEIIQGVGEEAVEALIPEPIPDAEAEPSDAGADIATEEDLPADDEADESEVLPETGEQDDDPEDTPEEAPEAVEEQTEQEPGEEAAAETVSDLKRALKAELSTLSDYSANLTDVSGRLLHGLDDLRTTLVRHLNEIGGGYGDSAAIVRSIRQASEQIGLYTQRTSLETIVDDMSGIRLQRLRELAPQQEADTPLGEAVEAIAQVAGNLASMQGDVDRSLVLFEQQLENTLQYGVSYEALSEAHTLLTRLINNQIAPLQGDLAKRFEAAVVAFGEAVDAA